MKYKWLPIGILVGIFVVLSALPVRAAEAFSLRLTPSVWELGPEQTCQIVVSLKGNPQTKLAGCQLLVEYDESRLTLQRMTTSPAISSRDFKTSLQSSSAIGIYAAAKQGIAWNTEFVTLVFQVNEDAPPGSAEVGVTLDGLVDLQLQRLSESLQESVTLSIREPESAHAFLYHLEPSYGTLEPAFSPDHTEYQMTVPYEVESLTFEADPGEQGSVRVNRKNLNRAGMETVFTITATAADGTTKKQYTVTVHRLEKGEASSPSNLPQNGPPSSETSTIDAPPAQTVSSKTASSKSSTVRSTASSKTASSKPVQTAGSHDASSALPEPVPADIHSTQYLSQNTNRMPGFLLGILCGCIAMLLGIAILLLLLQRRKRSK